MIPEIPWHIPWSTKLHEMARRFIEQCGRAHRKFVMDQQRFDDLVRYFELEPNDGKLSMTIFGDVYPIEVDPTCPPGEVFLMTDLDKYKQEEEQECEE